MALKEAIMKRKPDVIALQEVWLKSGGRTRDRVEMVRGRRASVVCIVRRMFSSPRRVRRGMD